MTHEFRGNTRERSEAATKPRRAKSQRRQADRADSAPPTRDRGGRSLAQLFAAIFGLTFLLVGIGGFIPGITSNYDELSLFGTDSHAELLGLFRVSILHNIVHMLFGIGLLAAARESWSKLYLLGGGLAYAGVAAYGFLIDKSSDANFLPVNHNDNWLHVALTGALILAGLIAIAADRNRRSSHA